MKHFFPFILIALFSNLFSIQAQQISIIHSPSGYETGAGSGYLDNPIEFQGNSYFRYESNSGTYHLAKFENGMLTVFSNPTDYGQSPSTGYIGEPIVVGNKLYLRYLKNWGGYYHLAEFDGTTITILPNPSGYSGASGYLGLPYTDGVYLYMNFMNSSNGDNTLMRYNGTTFTPLVLSGHHYVGTPITMNGASYFRFKVRSGNYYVLAQVVNTTISVIASPPNYNMTNRGYQAGNTIVYNNKLYMRYQKNDGQGNMMVYDGGTLAEISSPFNHSFVGNSSPTYLHQGKIYMLYRNATINYYLAEYDGTTLREITSPTGYQAAFRGYVGEPYSADSVLYLKYSNDNGGQDLAMYKDSTLTIIPSPVGYQSANNGYAGIPIKLDSSLVVLYLDDNGNRQVATYKNGILTILPNSQDYTNAGRGYVGTPIVFDNKLYMQFISNTLSYDLATFDGMNLHVIANPLTHSNFGYQGLPFIHNNELYIKMRGNDQNTDLARLLNCSASTSTISPTVCDFYTAPDGMVYSSTNTYTAIIPNAAGCDSMITINLTVTTIDSSLVLNGTTLTATEVGATYQWVDCNTGMFITGETSSNFSPTTSGNYSVIVTKNNCSDTSSCISVVITGLEPISAVNILAAAYPNPTNGNINIVLEETQNDIVIEVRNLMGQLVQTKQIDTAISCDLNIEGSSGIYWLTVKTKTAETVFKVIKL